MGKLSLLIFQPKTRTKMKTKIFKDRPINLNNVLNRNQYTGSNILENHIYIYI